MAIVEHAYPLDSIVNYDGNGVPSFDRAVSSMVLRNLLHQLFTDGILMPENSTAMQVVENNNMTVKVNAGFCVIQGAMRNFADKTLSITAAHTTLDRIDTVVARLNLNQDVRDILLYVVAGTPAENPVRPTLTRTDSVYELGLADLFIPAGTTTIPQARITDTRLDTQICGVVSSVSEFDTTTLYNQIQADLAHFKSENEADFDIWFDRMKGQLTEDAAGRLQSEIEALQDDVSTKENKHALVTATIAATDWANGVYSFETDYPNATYDIEQIQPYGTVDQLKAWGKAMIIGNVSGNTITCRGTVPSVNIPIMFYVKRK